MNILQTWLSQGGVIIPPGPPIVLILLNGIGSGVPGQISAGDFIQAVSDGTPPFMYSLSTDGGQTFSAPNADPFQLLYNITCDSFFNSPVQITIRVTDQGNQSVEESTFLDVFDFGGFCT